MSSSIERHLAVDLHKHYVMVGGVNTHQEIVLTPRRVELDHWLAWAQANLHQTDVLVVEATTNTWDFYDQTLPFVGQLLVADPRQVAWIAKTRVKTDPSDVLKLARLSAAHLVPTVWVPPQPVHELRALLAHRRRLVKTPTMLKNRLQSLLHRHHLVPPVSEPFGPQYASWWSALPVSPTEQLHVRHDLATLEQLAAQLAEIDDELRRLSCEAPWAADVPYLLQLPGVGLIIAMTILAAVDDVTRFESAKKLVGYSGLGTSIHDSGLTHRTGRITKQGRKELRYVLVEATWSAVDHNHFWRTRFQKLGTRMAEHKAIVAIARELLVAIWHVLTERTAEQHADPKLVAIKLMRWSWQLTEAQRGGLTSRQFIRYHLMRLQLGDDLTHIRYGNMPRRIAPVEEVLALDPERRPAG